MSLQICHRTHDRVDVVTVVGEIDNHTSSELRDGLRQVIDDRPRDVVIDISGVPFMDSTALGVLIGALKRARAAGGTVRLAGPDALASRILRVTGLVRVFSIHPDLAGALASPHHIPDQPPAEPLR